MARVFDITAASDAVRLDGKGQGEIAFTASNVSGRPLRGRANLVPQDAASKAWLSVSGEPERDFPAGGTQQFSVKVAVPPGTKAGKYNFRLDVVSVQNPDEDYTQGPNVAVSLTLAPPPPWHFQWWILVVAAVILIGLGGVLWYVLRPNKVTVPDVTHKSIDDANQVLAQAKLKEADTPQTVTDTPAGQVMSQQPNAGDSVAPGTTVTLIVAAAPTKVTVPNVRGHSVPDANTILTQFRLKVGTVTSVLTDPGSVDKILDQQPSDGEQVSSDAAVNLKVGAVSVRVPSTLVGHPYDEARATLASQHLEVGKVTNDPNGRMSPGMVLRTNPDAGQPVATDSAVDLVVQQETVLVPDLTNPPQTIDQAVFTLQTAKLKLGTVTGNFIKANIIDQNPKGGTRQPVGTEVSVSVPGLKWWVNNPKIFVRTQVVNPGALRVVPK